MSVLSFRAHPLRADRIHPIKRCCTAIHPKIRADIYFFDIIESRQLSYDKILLSLCLVNEDLFLARIPGRRPLTVFRQIGL